MIIKIDFLFHSVSMKQIFFSENISSRCLNENNKGVFVLQIKYDFDKKSITDSKMNISPNWWKWGKKKIRKYVNGIMSKWDNERVRKLEEKIGIGKMRKCKTEKIRKS